MFKWYTQGVKRKGVVTCNYPAEHYEPYEGSLGMPEVDTSACMIDQVCVRICPTAAIEVTYATVTIDLGRCIFCGECARACPSKAMRMSKKFELAVKDSDGLKVVYRIDRRKQ